MTALILYTTENGNSRIKLRADEQTVWLTQLEMAGGAIRRGQCDFY